MSGQLRAENAACHAPGTQEGQQLIQQVELPAGLDQVVSDFKRLWFHTWKRTDLLPTCVPVSADSSAGEADGQAPQEAQLPRTAHGPHLASP